MFKLVTIRRGYPLALAGEYTASTFSSLEDALAALGDHTAASGYAGTFNPRHPAATEYYLVARSTKDSTVAVVTDTEGETNMSVFADSMKNRGTVEPVELSVSEIARTVYPGQLVWFVPPVTGGKVAARLISIDLEKSECELEITATRSQYYPRGSREFHVPYTRIFKREISKQYWPRPRFSLQWLDYPTAKERAGEQWQKLSALVAKQPK